jgi:DNA-binding winged helix-turn-helix (wHTH) protein
MSGDQQNRVAVFGSFRFDLSSGELLKHGLKLQLEDQPAQVLRFLIEQADVVVSREELRKLLWPNGVHLDFEHGLNKSINKLRTVLGDNPDAPLFIATLRGHGYRFIGPVEIQKKETALAVGSVALQEDRPVVSRVTFRRPRWKVWTAAMLSLVGIGGAVAWVVRANRVPASAQPVPVPLTSYPGAERSPAFSPDGSQVGFIWDGGKPGAQGVYAKVNRH